MKDDKGQVPKRLLKASKHAHLLRASLEQLLSLLPEAHQNWHTMVPEIRRIELHLEAVHAVFEEMLQRDPASYAALLMLPDNASSGGSGGVPRPLKPSQIIET